MNPINGWSTMAVAVLVLAISGVHDAGAQARARVEPKPAIGGPGAGGAVIRLRELTGDGPRGLVRTPVYSASASGGRAAPRDWAELTVQFDTDPEWVDEISFQYYALLYTRATKEYTLLKGLVTHIDVARGRGHRSSAYIRPNTLLRYGDVLAVAVEAFVKGEEAGTVSEGKLADRQALPPEWWKSPKLIPRDGSILNRTQTPFAFISVDDYEATK